MLSSFRQTLAMANEDKAYEIKLQAYYLAAVASLFMDHDPKAIHAIAAARYTLDMTLGIPAAREGMSQMSKKYIMQRAAEWWNGTQVASK